MNIVITGALGFVGKNLTAELSKYEEYNIKGIDIEDSVETLDNYIKDADFVFHLAGVNRPKDESEFEKGNKDFTKSLLDLMNKHNKTIPVVITSSIQAAVDNPYGKSKKAAEDLMFEWAKETGSSVYVYRLPNVFGKWCRPNYNSVTATFCHNIANDLPIQISNPSNELTLVYINDILKEFVMALQGKPNKKEDGYCYVAKTNKTTLGELADTIKSFRESRNTLVLPDFSDDFTKCLYATYVSYLPQNSFGYKVEMKHDNRGWLSEIIKSKAFGQIFVSRTKPGITRGNHWHHTKVEKFIVIEGKAVIRFRQIYGNEVIEVPVSGEEMQVVDIPTGYTHSIVNVGDTDVITLFWSDQIFDPNDPDTYFLEV